MIEMPIFPDEQWYLTQVKKLFMNGNVADKNVEKKFSKSKEENALLKALDLAIDMSDVGSVSVGNNIFEKLILAPFPVLEQIYRKVNSYGEGFFRKKDVVKGKEVLKVKEEWEPFVKGYDTFIKRHKNIELIEWYGIKSCPYCNENYIFNREQHSGAQLDHFYPKERYPLFALCLYNIVPSCTTCNHIKQEKELKVSPHDHTRNFEHMRISYTPRNCNWINDFHALDIEFRCDLDMKDDMEANIKELYLENAYQNHRDYVQEIVNKAFLYNHTSLNTLKNSLSGMFQSEEEMLRIVFGNYIEKNEMLKRPLSKLTRDILIELKIL